MSALPMRHGGCGSAGVAVSVPTTFWQRSTAGSDSLSTTTVLSQRSTRNSRGSTIRSWRFLPNLRSRQGSDPSGSFLCKTGRCRRQCGLQRKAHPEPLPSFRQRKAPRAFHHILARGPGRCLHYQCRDYAPLQSRPPWFARSDRSLLVCALTVGCQGRRRCPAAARL